MQPNEKQNTSIRLPNWLRQKIEEMARQERRSFNAMTNLILEEAVKNVRLDKASSQDA